jgi:hypothetical protein
MSGKLFHCGCVDRLYLSLCLVWMVPKAAAHTAVIHAPMPSVHQCPLCTNALHLGLHPGFHTVALFASVLPTGAAVRHVVTAQGT